MTPEELKTAKEEAKRTAAERKADGEAKAKSEVQKPEAKVETKAEAQKTAPKAKQQPKPKAAETRNIFKHYPGVSPGFTQEMTAAFDRLPPKVRDALTDGKVTVHVSETLIQARPDLKGVTPRGWPPGNTWDEAEGMYHHHSYATNMPSEVHITEKRFSRFQKKYVTTHRGVGVFNHEVGHAFDYAKDQASTSLEFRKAYEADVKAFRDRAKRGGAWEIKKAESQYAYFLQPGEAGPSECFAETFGELVGAGSSDGEKLHMTSNFPRCAEVIERLMIT
jgi:hypothetical protein